MAAPWSSWPASSPRVLVESWGLLREASGCGTNATQMLAERYLKISFRMEVTLRN